MKKEHHLLEKEIRKSSLNAEDSYDYKKLVYPNIKLLPLELKEEKEILRAQYDLTGCTSFTEIKKTGRQDKLRILLDVAELLDLRKDYSFTIKPENLYYDRNYRVHVMDRDIYRRGETDADSFLEEYKALIGYTLQKKYSFSDYYEGGKDLFSKNKLLKPIGSMETLEEITDYLETEYTEVTNDIQENKQLVNKSSHTAGLFYIVLSTILLLAGIGYISYYSFMEKPVLSAKLQAETDFIKGDYIQVVDDLEELQMEKLAYDQKYILSVSYVKTESLTVEQKENILKKLPVNGDEKLMEYWIHIGRRNPIEAENIAMQKSDDELLLYAYMQEKDTVETDTEMTGEEKAAKLSTLEGKIKELSEKYLTEEE